MSEFFKTIKEYFILLFGIGLFTYGLFSFDNLYGSFYFYSHISLILLTAGAILIVIGLLKIRKES